MEVVHILGLLGMPLLRLVESLVVNRVDLYSQCVTVKH